MEAVTGLVLPAFFYGLSLYALTLTSWWLTWIFVPGYCRESLRVVMTLLGQLVLTAVLVQSLGLLGLLQASIYGFVCLTLGAGALYGLRRRGTDRSLARALARQGRLWIRETPMGIGLLGAGAMLFMVLRCSLVEGADSLSLHGPLIVQWLQAGKIELFWKYNYPLCWEYQFTPNLLIMGSDVLVVLPRLWIALTLLLSIKEVARQIGMTGGVAQLTGWLFITIPLIFGTRGEGTFKNDPALATGLLACLVAVDRLRRKQTGGFWLLQLGAFLARGTKSTGILLGGGLLCLGTLLAALPPSRRPTPRRSAAVAAGMILLYATPLALPLLNFAENGSPFYPIVMRVGSWIELPGSLDLKGTSILENRDKPRLSYFLIRGAGHKIGFDAPLVGLIFIAGTIVWSLLWLRFAARSGLKEIFGDSRYTSPLFFAGSAIVLWILWSATPWTAGRVHNPMAYASTGASLRYGLAAIALTYIGCVAWLFHLFGNARVTRLLSVLIPVAIYQRWSSSFWHLAREHGGGFSPVLLITGFVAALAILWGLAKSVVWIYTRLPARRRPQAILPAILLVVASACVPVYGKWVAELRKNSWGASPGGVQIYRDIWTYVNTELPKGSIIVTNLEFLGFNHAYFLMGLHLSNRLIEGPDPIEGPMGKIPPEASHFYFTYHVQRPKNFLAALESLKTSGWKVAAGATGNQAFLLKRACEGPNCWAFGDGFESGNLDAWSSKAAPKAPVASTDPP